MVQGQAIRKPTPKELDMMRPSQRFLAMSRYRMSRGIRLPTRPDPTLPVRPVLEQFEQSLPATNRFWVQQLIEDAYKLDPILVYRSAPLPTYPPTPRPTVAMYEEDLPLKGLKTLVVCEGEDAPFARVDITEDKCNPDLCRELEEVFQKYAPAKDAHLRLL